MKKSKARFLYHPYLITILLCGLSTLTFCSHPRIHNDLKTQNLRGPVKSITESYRDASDTLNPCQSWFYALSWRTEFNIQGYLTKRVKRTCDDSFHTIYTTTENSAGRIASSTQLPSDYTGYSHRTIKYDDTNPIEMADYNEAGNMVLKVKYKYDVSHNRIEETLYNMPGERSNSTTSYKYDNKGNNIECLVVNTNDSQIISKTIFTYDTRGYIKDESLIEHDTLFHRLSFLYDTLGNRTSITAYYSHHALRYKDQFEYKYDPTGNWIYMRYYRDDSLISICSRSIEYYR